MASHPHSPDPPPGDPDSRFGNWAQELKRCDFAGQIDLAESELNSLAVPVRQAFESSIATPPKHAARVVSDEEERQAVDDILRKLLNEESVRVESIVILTPHGQGKSKWRPGNKLAGHPISWDAPAPPNAIACATIHSFKGLESPVIILAESVGERIPG